MRRHLITTTLALLALLFMIAPTTPADAAIDIGHDTDVTAFDLDADATWVTDADPSQDDQNFSQNFSQDDALDEVTDTGTLSLDAADTLTGNAHHAWTHGLTIWYNDGTVNTDYGADNDDPLDTGADNDGEAHHHAGA